MRQLDVFLGDNLVGHVVENRKGGRFEYEQSVADKLAGRPVLSMAFPAKGRPFGEAKTSAWFNGLLPEGSRRDEICRSLGVSPYDWIGLLAEIGWECAGAVRVFERGHKRARELRFGAISPSALAEKLSSVTARLPQVESELFRMFAWLDSKRRCASLCRRFPRERTPSLPTTSCYRWATALAHIFSNPKASIIPVWLSRRPGL